MPQDTDIVEYRNVDVSGGENHKIEGRNIADNECTVLLNTDISIPGQVSKRLGPGPALVVSSNNPVRGMTAFVQTGVSYLIVACNSTLYFTSTFTSFTQCGSTVINTSTYCTFIPANNVLYIIDGAGALYKLSIVGAGQRASAVNLKDAGGNVIPNITDAVWFLNRMWYASGDFIYYSDVGNPESITNAQFQLSVGNGAQIRRLLTYRTGLLLAFKFGTGRAAGSIHLTDVSSDDPASFFPNVVPQFEGINLISPQMITRMGNDQNAEIAFYTLEGRQTLNTTALDRLVQPSLPFSDYEIDNVKAINASSTTALNNQFSVFYQNELIDWICNVNDPFTTGTTTTPNMALGYRTDVAKQNIQQGWSTISLMNGTCACQATIAGANNLFIGTAAGTVARAFQRDNGETFKVVYKRVTHNLPENQKMGQDFTLSLAENHVGNINVTFNFDDNTQQAITPIATTPTAGDAQTVTVPLLFPTQNLGRKRWVDVRVQLNSTSKPVVLGWCITANVMPVRRIPLTEAIGPATTLTAFNQTGLATTKYGG